MLAAVFAVLVVVDLLRIRHDLQRGQATLTSLDFATVDEHGGITPVAAAAAADLHRAAERAATSPWLSALSYLPVVGTQVRAVRDLTKTADHVGALGEATAKDVQEALDRAAGAGPGGRVALVDAIAAAADRLDQDLRSVEVGAHGWLVPPLGSARHDLVRHLDNARSRLDDGRATLATLRGFLAGPRRYLILGGNNAEMRSAGIATTSGVASIHDGAVDVGDFVNNGVTAIPRPGVPLPDGWDWLFGYLDPGIAYANMMCSPNFPLVGQTAAALSARNVYGPVDGVIYVDTVALQSVLSVVGPVTVDGITYDGDNAARLLVNENYLRFSAPDQTERRDAQGRVARAIFDALNSRPVSLLKLAATLQHLARARHLAAWSSLPGEQTLWHDVGADGARDPNDVMVTSQDLGASKLDFYVRENVAMNVQAEGDNRRITLSISVTNPPHPTSVTYVEGGSIYAGPGEYGTYVVVFLPRDAFDIVHDDPTYTSSANDGDLSVTTFTARVRIGTTKTINMSFLLPSRDKTVTVVPAARVTPSEWTVGPRRFDDTVPTPVYLGAVPTGILAEPPGWFLVGLLLFGAGTAVAGGARGRVAVADRNDRMARVDAEIGWWMMIAGLAMIAVQAAIIFVG